MNVLSHPLRPSPLLAALVLAFPMWSSLAHAESTFAASGSFSIGADTAGPSTPKSGSFNVPAQSGLASGSATGDATTSYDSSAQVSASATGDGHFGGAAITSEIYGSMAPMTSSVTMVYSDTLVNTSGAAQNASFSLAISSLQFLLDSGTRSGTNRVSFAANVYLDGASTPLWSTTFSYDDGSSSATFAGQDIGLASQVPADCPDYSCIFRQRSFGISDYQATLSLGSIAAGDSVGIRYEVDLATETNMYGGDASITFNDPSSFSGSGVPAAGRLGFDTASTPVSPVPEPETYLMMAAGLGVLAASRRRRAR